eukprot:4565415-Prymnesium_polylepis.1
MPAAGVWQMIFAIGALEVNSCDRARRAAAPALHPPAPRSRDGPRDTVHARTRRRHFNGCCDRDRGRAHTSSPPTRARTRLW